LSRSSETILDTNY